MKIYRIYEDFYGTQKPCAYVATREIVEDYIRANIPSIIRVTRSTTVGTCKTVWYVDNNSLKKFPGFSPKYLYHGKRSDNSKVSMGFEEIDVIDA
jgi:hypothetical protein